MEAFPEHIHQIPLTPEMDSERGYKAYKWLSSSLPAQNTKGSRPYNEGDDNFANAAVRFPWLSDRRAFQPYTTDGNAKSTVNSLAPAFTLNNSYSHLAASHYPEGGYEAGEASFKHMKAWEKLLAYHHGLYQPAAFKDSLSEDDIRIKTNRFADIVHLDDPTDPCRYLQIQEYQCLHTMQTYMDPQGASKKCVKWFNEWQQCKWDNEKLIKGYSYIEDRPASKHKPYIGAPDNQYS